ncbi:DUF4124 domain-containing protein [Pseudomarimonas arenosa]|uniref:DUF4124 domain-containing protein n=1 Tax=Pseudomarimonas arenosa TaxID=2774145 RepID=A0AAW3ZN45_9GAMM|nr:DUF4124 domain-containing protein [Pseudomarimonas arenosa]MBD8526064.1 DUF4124 domain-containing protein [Pseudomarimonas arenosa]
MLLRLALKPLFGSKNMSSSLGRSAFVLCALAVLVESASAQVFKCAGQDGRVVYQQTACAADQAGGEHDVRVAPPSDPDAARRAKQDAQLRERNHAYWLSLQQIEALPERETVPSAAPARKRNEERIMRCEGAGQVWYSATRECHDAERIDTKDGYLKDVQYRHGRSVSVTQACEEIRSGAASLQIDTYQRNQGMDPCK